MYKVKCNQCDKIHEIEVYLNVVGEDPDRGMGTQYFYSGMAELFCDCGQKITISVDGSEYPIDAGIEIDDINVDGGKLVA